MNYLPIIFKLSAVNNVILSLLIGHTVRVRLAAPGLSNGCQYLRDLTRHALGASNRSTVQCRATQGRPIRTASHLSLSIIVNVQGKLELITGIPASNQILSLLNSQEDTRVIAELNDDSKPLEFYCLRDWQVIKVKD
jgi:hypothetical protein